jgi:hypothetical protein
MYNNDYEYIIRKDFFNSKTICHAIIYKCDFYLPYRHLYTKQGHFILKYFIPHTTSFIYIITYSTCEKKKSKRKNMSWPLIYGCYSHLLFRSNDSTLSNTFTLLFSPISLFVLLNQSSNTDRYTHTHSKIQIFQQTKNKNTSSYDRLSMWRPNHNIE